MNRISLTLLSTLLVVNILAQKTLTLDEGIEKLLLNNYDIRLSEKSVESARINTGIYNSGYLPRVQLNGNASYSLGNQDMELSGGTTISVTNAESSQYNASLGVNYLLYSGGRRKILQKQLKEKLHISEIEAQNTLEKALNSYYTAYYRTALAHVQTQMLEEALDISKQRLTRARYRYEFGQGNKLEVLNARVDTDNDSLRYVQSLTTLNNLKRNLLQIIGEKDTGTDFEVEKEVHFGIIPSREELLERLEENKDLLGLQKNIELLQLSERLQKTALYPNLAFSTSYSWNYSDNPPGSSTAMQITNYGWNNGLSLSWDIFDGGNTKIRRQQAKIQTETALIRKEKTEQQLRTLLLNTYDTYENNLSLWKTAKENLETARLNYLRSKEMFDTGNINSLQFRQAQLNLLNAENAVYAAMYDAKLSEIDLLKLTGALYNGQSGD